MKITKIHSVYRFKQSPCLADYLNHNTQLRTEAKTKLEKSFFKLMNNAFFGKTMENIRDSVSLKFTSHGHIQKIIYR